MLTELIFLNVIRVTREQIYHQIEVLSGHNPVTAPLKIIFWGLGLPHKKLIKIVF